MNPLSLSAILRRINQRLDRLGLSDRAASMAAGLSPGLIRSMRRQCEAGSQHSMTLRTVQQLATALYTTSVWLQTGAGDEEEIANHIKAASRPVTIPVVGEVAAGRWLQIDSDAADAPQIETSIPPDPSYSDVAQHALLVRGTSINRVAMDGDFLICVDLEMTGIEPQNGNMVIVERRRPQDGLREISAKRFFSSAKRTELRYDSLDPRYADAAHPQYQPPLLFTKDQTDTHEQVTILALAIRVWRVI